jgi:hypothetical protein
VHVGCVAQSATDAHAGQLSAGPSSSQVPAAQLVHCESVAEVHVTSDVHSLIGVHGRQVPPASR